MHSWRSKSAAWKNTDKCLPCTLQKTQKTLLCPFFSSCRYIKHICLSSNSSWLSWILFLVINSLINVPCVIYASAFPHPRCILLLREVIALFILLISTFTCMVQLKNFGSFFPAHIPSQSLWNYVNRKKKY